MKSPTPVAASRPSAAISTLNLRRFPKRRCAQLLAFACGLSVAVAQYAIPWWKVAGGGGTSTSGVFTVSGTIGQPDAGWPMTNGQYSVTGGFWAWPTLIQSPGAPTLHLTNAAPGFATLWWTPPTPGYVLQETPSLTPATWTNAPSGTNNPVSVPAGRPMKFYRLQKP